VRLAPAGNWRRAVALALAALVGFGWQETIAHGDGLTARPEYLWIRIGLVIASVGGAVIFTNTILLPGRLRDSRRQALGAAVIVAAVLFDHNVLRSYREFHGYLTTVCIVGIAWAGARFARHPASQILAATVLAAAFALTGFYIRELVSMEGHLRRYSPLAGNMLRGLPFTANPVFTAEPIVDPKRRLSSEESARASAHHKHLTENVGVHQYGKNVIVVVLESTRADTWSDPKITPAFHRWKSNGLYVPNAIAQYPATPLAYAALFASLPPSVVVQQPFWAKQKLMTSLKRSFDTWILSEPDSYWFRTSSISKFVTPSDTARVYAHNDTNEGLSHFWKEISRLPNSKSFFAWIHLYDPHDPYVSHRGHDFGRGHRAKYRSEVAYVDHELGRFMEWFYASKLAQNTLVVVVGDHGEGQGEVIEGQPFWGHHVQVHGSVARIPFFISGPGIPKNETRTDLHVAQLDLMPTVFDFRGVPLPEGALTEGRSIYHELESPEARPLVTEAFSIRGAEFFALFERVHQKDADPEALRSLLARVNATPRYPPKFSLQLGRYKLVRDLLVRRSALYDTVADPGELKDLARERPKDLARLEQAFDEWRAYQTWTIQQADARDAAEGRAAPKAKAKTAKPKASPPAKRRLKSQR
jgi:hypothetical protein